MNKNLRIIFFVFLAVLLILSFFSCKKSSDKITDTIGISKIVSHPALDATEQGIQDELKDEGFTALNYDLQNANGDVNAAKQIATKFKSEKVRIAVGIATPTAQALVGTLTDIPVIFSAVTDPVGAGLVSSLDKGEKNVTGISDMTPVKQQIEFLTKIKTIKRLGHVYTSSEANAVKLAEIAKKSCEELGIEFIETTVTNSSEVKQAVQTIIDKIDGLYISTDNTVVSALGAITEVAMKNNVPIMSADPSSAETFDVLAAWGFDYYKMGRATGKMVAEILNGAKPADMPTRFMTDPSDVDLLINLDVAKKLGLSFPQDIIDVANKVVENGQLRTK